MALVVINSKRHKKLRKTRENKYKDLMKLIQQCTPSQRSIIYGFMVFNFNKHLPLYKICHSHHQLSNVLNWLKTHIRQRKHLKISRYRYAIIFQIDFPIEYVSYDVLQKNRYPSLIYSIHKDRFTQLYCNNNLLDKVKQCDNFIQRINSKYTQLLSMTSSELKKYCYNNYYYVKLSFFIPYRNSVRDIMLTYEIPKLLYFKKN